MCFYILNSHSRTWKNSGYFLNISTMPSIWSLQWRHNGCDSVSIHRRLDCLLYRLFRRRSKKSWKLCVTGVCEGNSPLTGEFPAPRASNAKNVSIWWRHHDLSHWNVKTARVYRPIYRTKWRLCYWYYMSQNTLSRKLHISPAYLRGVWLLIHALFKVSSY